jgi:hypothetical protein
MSHANEAHATLSEIERRLEMLDRSVMHIANHEMHDSTAKALGGATYELGTILSRVREAKSQLEQDLNPDE